MLMNANIQPITNGFEFNKHKAKALTAAAVVIMLLLT